MNTSTSLYKNINLFRWFLPVIFFTVTATYQLVVARYVQNTFGEDLHWAIEIIFYTIIVSLLTFWFLARINKWLEEKDHIEMEARASERRLATITYASADAILRINDQGNVDSWNRGAELIFGYLPEEIIGQPLTILFEGQSSAEKESKWLLDTVRRDGFLRGHETRCLKSDGQLIQVELTATNLAAEKTNGIEGVSMILRDITNRKNRESEIRKLNESLNQQITERTQELADKINELGKANAELQKLDQMRSEFVSLVSHQIRAPLSNMGGAVQRMQSDCGLINSTCNRMFSILEQQISHLDRLVRDVLNIYQLEAGKISLELEPISVFAVVKKEVEQTQARNIGRRIDILEKPGLPFAYADRDWVAEVLGNLLDNADKYSPTGEDIIIDIRADQNTITISVHDQGPGLSLDDQERIFDKFYRTDSSDSQPAYGYGLGLYICRMLIEAQGGRIWVDNHPNGGAIFSFNLPVWNE